VVAQVRPPLTTLTLYCLFFVQLQCTFTSTPTLAWSCGTSYMCCTYSLYVLHVSHILLVLFSCLPSHTIMCVSDTIILFYMFFIYLYHLSTALVVLHMCSHRCARPHSATVAPRDIYCTYTCLPAPLYFIYLFLYRCQSAHTLLSCLLPQTTPCLWNYLLLHLCFIFLYNVICVCVCLLHILCCCAKQRLIFSKLCTYFTCIVVPCTLPTPPLPLSTLTTRVRQLSIIGFCL